MERASAGGAGGDAGAAGGGDGVRGHGHGQGVTQKRTDEKK